MKSEIHVCSWSSVSCIGCGFILITMVGSVLVVILYVGRKVVVVMDSSLILTFLFYHLHVFCLFMVFCSFVSCISCGFLLSSLLGRAHVRAGGPRSRVRFM